MYKVIVKDGEVYVSNPTLIRYNSKDNTVLIQTEKSSDVYDTDENFKVLYEYEW